MTASHDSDERARAARALLASPILTDRRQPEQLAAVRRHAAPLKAMFSTVLGYHLIVESSFARLVKAPLTPDAPTRPARRAAGGEFTPRAYAGLALVCAALLATGTADQVLISGLVEQVRADAVTAGVEFDDSLTGRRNLVAAIELLVSWGVLSETDGTITGWSERQEEALLTINRALLPHLLTRPLYEMSGPADLTVAGSALPQPRRTLRRALVENPVVRRESLSDAERDALSRERTELARQLDESFGLVLEVRADGALAFDPDDQLTDLAFPGTGTVRQAALLLIDALIDAAGPHSLSRAEVDGVAVPGLLVRWEMVEAKLAELLTRHATAWRAEYAREPERLKEDVTTLLTGVGLAVQTRAGLVLHPAAARYRPVITHPGSGGPGSTGPGGAPGGRRGSVRRPARRRVPLPTDQPHPFEAPDLFGGSE
ncbi:TIGR02678 family protein [Frankia sp. R82]|uniref:TIGR02678 family protein n=1 Tax=Frankia sp. R82 TaxID=2950553 RepID=UPI0020433ECE|nr:TIGR02678 family protein [Frankia sp. R82]MCM3887341.1 TIGR02678 family protein [Frankia sp. R82]